MNTKRSFKLFIACMSLALICCFSLTGCNLLLNSLYPIYSTDTDTSSSSATGSDDGKPDFDLIDGLSIASTYIDNNGHLVIVYSDGSEQDLGRVVGNDGNVDVNIEGASNDASFATAEGLRSAVSVHCTFAVKNVFGTLSSATSAGAGVIYKLDKNTGDAFIITNYHVVFNENALYNNGISENISILLYGSEYLDSEIKAEFVGGSNNYDIAVLKVTGSELLKTNVYKEAKLADSDNIYVGQSAIAIGNPDDAGISASNGIISVYSEYITLNIGGTVSLRVMRIDTPVNSGNSGGGLYNEKGELIGIVNAKSGDSSLESIGYAIPSNIASYVAENIIDNCYGTELKTVQRAMLGVTLTITDSRAYLTEDGHITFKESVEVIEISEAGIANGALQVGDTILSVKLGNTTKEIIRQHQVIDFMLNARVGNTVYITVLRDINGVATEMTVELEITSDCITSY